MLEELKKIKELVNQNDYISFDIFDTLVLRNIEKPTDIFKIMERIIKEKYNINNFFNDRIEAEQKSRINQKNYESNLDRIYEFLNGKYNNYKTEIKQMEIELESDFIVENTFMKDIYNYCLDNNKKVLLISDMYLPNEVIIQILKNCGYRNINLYLSNEYLESKHLGGLYDIAKEKEKLSNKKWLHIGDNIHSDYNIPISKGINAYNYKNVYSRVNRKTESNSIELSILRGIQNNYFLNHDVTYWEEFGIKYISPIYYGFTNWLFNLTKEEKEIYFLSRDGYIIQKLYNMFKNEFKTKTNLKYLYTSRLAYQIPHQILSDKNKAIKLLTERNAMFNHRFTINEIFEILDFDISNYKLILNSFGFNEFDKELYDNDIFRLRKFLSFIYDDIKEAFQTKRNLTIEYLKQEGLEVNKKINLVDVGWRGSIQKTINELLNIKSIGYYFGTSSSIYDELKMETYGYAMDCGKEEDIAYYILDNIMMFEMIFSAPEGTLLKFEKKDNEIIPILEKSDYIEKNIDIFQNSALEIIKEYIRYYKYFLNLNIKDLIVDYKDFINYKDYEDIKEFKNLSNDVGYSSVKKKYVNVYSKEYVLKNMEKFNEKNSYSLWKNSFYINEITNQEELDEFRKKIYDYNTSNKYRIFNKNAIKKAFKNPKKAINVIKIKLNKDKEYINDNTNNT